MSRSSHSRVRRGSRWREGSDRMDEEERWNETCGYARKDEARILEAFTHLSFSFFRAVSVSLIAPFHRRLARSFVLCCLYTLCGYSPIKLY